MILYSNKEFIARRNGQYVFARPYAGFVGHAIYAPYSGEAKQVSITPGGFYTFGSLAAGDTVSISVFSGSVEINTDIEIQASPFVIASNYGVLPTNSAAVNFANLQTLIDNVYGSGSGFTWGGEICIGVEYTGVGASNTIDVSAPIVIPDRVKIRGSGSRSTKLRAGDGFPDDEPLIKLQRPDLGLGFGYGVSNLFVDANSKTGSSGISLIACQEQTAITDVVVSGFLDSGISLDTGAGAGIKFSNLECYPSGLAPATAVGIRQLGGIVVCDQYTFVGSSSAAEKPQAAWLVNHAWMKVAHFHAERVTYGVQAQNLAFIAIDAITPSLGGVIPTDDLIHIESSEVRGYVLSAFKNGSVTNVIRDTAQNITIQNYADAFFPPAGQGSSQGVSIYIGKKKIQAPLAAPEGFVVASRGDLMLTSTGIQKKTDDGDNTGFVVL